MNENSTFAISIIPDTSNLEKIINELNRILEYISKLSDPTKSLSKGMVADIPNLQSNLGALVYILSYVYRGIKWAAGIYTAIKTGIAIYKKIKDEQSKPQGDLEQLIELRNQVLKQLTDASRALDDVKNSGDVAGAFTPEGLPRNLEFIQERINTLNAFVEKLNKLIDQLTIGEIKPDIPNLPEPRAIPKIGQPGEILLVPKIDQVGPLLEEYKQIQEDYNNKLIIFRKVVSETSDELLQYENMLAMTGNTSGVVSDATNGVMASVFKLKKEGIDPLTGGTKEADKAVLDLALSYEAGAVVFGYVVDRAGKAEETLGTLNSTTGDLSVRSEELAASQDEVTRSVADGSAAMDNAGASAEQFSDTLEQVENSGGFFDGIKQGFEDFVDNVESNSELMADFFANTLTEMSQNFSDLFYNVLTGRFDNLKDLAKQAFEAILRAFLDMVAAIATRQIVISIAGAIGIGAKGASATDYLGLGKQAAGLGSDLGGLFGGGGSSSAAIGGGAAAIGGGISAVGAGASAAGGASSVGASLGLSGISSVGTVPTGGAEEMEYQMAA